jgi:hypothetical protein
MISSILLSTKSKIKLATQGNREIHYHIIIRSIIELFKNCHPEVLEGRL